MKTAPYIHYSYVMQKDYYKKENAKKYLLKYIKELKVHFDLTEGEIKEILRRVYYTKTPLCKFLRQLRKVFKENI